MITTIRETNFEPIAMEDLEKVKIEIINDTFEGKIKVVN